MKRPGLNHLKIVKRDLFRTCGARRRSRLTYANVMSTIAVFLALGGVSYAAATYTGADIIDGSLTGADVQDKSLAKADIAYNAVGTSELESNSVIGGHISDGAVTGADVKDKSLAKADIAYNAVGTGELESSAVISGHIADGSLKSQDVASTFQAPDSARLGGLAASAYETRVYRAFVTESGYGDPAYSDGMVSARKVGTGAYIVKFSRGVSTCSPAATLWGDLAFETITVTGRIPWNPYDGVPDIGSDELLVTIGHRGGNGTAVSVDSAFNLVVVC